MPVLENPLHERLCQEIIKDPRKMKDAGIRAGLSPKTAGPSVSRILRQPEVKKRLIELQTQAAVGACRTQDELVRMLAEDRGLAHAERNAGAAVSATMGIAKVRGLIVDKSIQATKPIKDMTKDELKQFLGRA